MSELNAQQVVDYLQHHPDFLIQHPELLAQLELQQQAQGATSLVHIQQRQLREHNTLLKNQIASMSKYAAQNEQVYRLFSLCHQQLCSNNDFDALASNLQDIICSNPDISDCRLVKYDTKYAQLVEHRLSNSGHYLGRINQQERDLLFSDTTQSTAIYLIGDINKPIAILAFASNNANHFEPAQDTLFVLDFVVALQSRLLELA
ncbi:hypothetical protein PNIG_a0112 [Pseudoalteromonas nigrifaciens]|uniref:DUF484 domain-containing protein n=1 Tax=Pseudoalteromonas nigrifaciens TaxID=28109 RepID=A0AAC9XVH7_9GAMM|nr:DUF484 family protein [Pseudoalteromonas nigrifaciens]ASM52456.1 hypothetical protein PNIG_a0112 [Pseudoalteromonas nigrifaciens]GEN42791.1 hypothetical protein PNI02_22570 [Pseudoalteromonas nigrifaciens]SUC50611.1 Uncharacterized protein conserved in bacteria [Pseudoalteromonas nigrifaciens]